MSKQGSKSRNQCIITNGSDINSEDHDSCKDGKSDKDIIREEVEELNKVLADLVRENRELEVSLFE